MALQVSGCFPVLLALSRLLDCEAINKDELDELAP